MIIASPHSDMLEKNGCSFFENFYQLRDWGIESTIIIMKKAQAMPGSQPFFRCSTPFTNLTQLGPVFIPTVGGGQRVGAVHSAVTLESN